MPRTVEAIRSFFDQVKTRTSRKTLIQEEEEPQRSAEDEREDTLRDLAQHPAVRSALIPMFQERIEDIDKIIPDCLESHAKLCALEGRKAEAQTYLRMFQEYIGE